MFCTKTENKQQFNLFSFLSQSDLFSFYSIYWCIKRDDFSNKACCNDLYSSYHQLTVPVTTDCPHLFILLPVNRDGLSFDSDQRLYASTLVPDGYAVHLLCEFPDGYHVTYEPGYRLRNPRDFVRRYGGHVVSTLRLLVKLANSTVVSAECAARSRAVAKTADALIKDLTTRFPTLKTIIGK